MSTERDPAFEVATEWITSLPAQVELVLKRRVVRRTTVTLRILDPAGNPVVDAKVGLYRPQTGPGMPYRGASVLLCAASDGEGRAVLPDLDPDRSYRIHIRDLPEQDLWGTALEEWTPRDEEITLRRALSITGRVVDEAGRPFANATVARTESGAHLCQGTDAQGSFRLTLLQPGPVTLHAAPPQTYGRWLDPVTVEAGARDIVLRVPRGEGLHVFVGNWPEGARGSAQLTSVRSSSDVRFAPPCDDGVFRFEGLHPGETYILWIPAVGEDRLCLLDRDVRGGKARRDVMLVPGETIRGVINGPSEGRPYHVSADGQGYEVRGKVNASNNTFEIHGLPPGTCRVVACTRGMAETLWAKVQARPGEKVELTLAQDSSGD